MATLNPALRDFWTTQADIKVLKGGRDSSKTWDAAGFAIFLAQSYKLKFLCMRQYQNKIAESVYAVLVVQIHRFGLTDEFQILNNVIRHKHTGSEFHFYGIRRNIEEIKGFEGVDIGWIEEGQGLTKEQWRHIEPTLRKDGAEAWIVYNPHLVTDFVETNFKHDPANGVIVRHINYDENPFLSNTSRRRIERLKASDHDEYEHVYLGIPWTDDDAVIIKRSWLEACVDAHIVLGIEEAGAHRLGFDIADSGKDLCAQVHAHGIVAKWGENWKGKEDELLQSCTRVYNKAITLGAHITYDSIGVGATAGAKFQELNDQRTEQALAGKIKYSKFIAGASVANPDDFYIDTEDEKITNKDFFSNLKSQGWWLVADRARNTYNAVHRGEHFEDDELLSLSGTLPNLAEVITQLSTPRRKFDAAGRVKVESKEDLAKRDVDSPNDADAFIMAYAPQTVDHMAELLAAALRQ